MAVSYACYPCFYQEIIRQAAPPFAPRYELVIDGWCDTILAILRAMLFSDLVARRS
jgi:hypothetical protein